MPDRRAVIGMLAALGLAAPAAPRAAAAAQAPGFFVVNGWVLTGADLIALGIDAA